jgi:hypothetical protein
MTHKDTTDAVGARAIGPIKLPRPLTAFLATSTEEPLAFSLDFDVNQHPKVGDLFWVQEEFCAHWGRPCEGGLPLYGFAVQQSDGTIASATRNDPLHVYYLADGRELPLEHLTWLAADEMQIWASRMTLEVTADSSGNNVNRCVLKLRKHPIKDVILSLSVKPLECGGSRDQGLMMPK